MSEKLARGILPALCTAFDDSGERVDGKRIAALLRHLIDAGSHGFFVCGGTGEAGELSTDERKLIAEVAAREVSGAVPLIVQVGKTSTESAVELAQHAASIGGIDAVASVAPVDRPNDLAAAVEHYAAIGAASDLPFYVYWLANAADQSVTAAQYLEAMKAVPNFTGVKFTDYNLFMFQQLIDLSGGAVNAISGPDEICLAAMAMGSDAGIGTTYNIMPRMFVALRRDFEAGEMAAALKLQTKINAVISVLARFGVIAAVKAALGWRGVPVGPPRVSDPLGPEQEAVFRAAVEALAFDPV